MRAGCRRFSGIFLAGAIGLALACGSAGSNQPPAGFGQLAVDMVDAPNPVVDEIWVNVTQVTAHSTSAGWTTVSNTPLEVDLLKLQTYAVPLGLVNLPAGTVTQIRLHVSQDGNYVVTGGNPVPLEVPSGSESGIKIHGPWEIAACSRTSVTLDFDGNKSIWYHPTGQGDEWILRPVIRVKKSDSAAVGCGEGGGEGSGTPGGFGSPCSGSTDCLSGICNDAKCAKGCPGAPCLSGADCAGGSCASDLTCAPGSAGSASTTCSANTDCLSCACEESVCAPGGQGAPCSAAQDCRTLFCSGGVCAPADV